MDGTAHLLAPPASCAKVHGGDGSAQEGFEPNKQHQPQKRAADTILAAGSRYVVRGGDVEVLEGEAPAGRTVLLEFPAMQAALNWYRSDETAIRKIREARPAHVCTSSTAPLEIAEQAT